MHLSPGRSLEDRPELRHRTPSLLPDHRIAAASPAQPVRWPKSDGRSRAPSRRYAASNRRSRSAATPARRPVGPPGAGVFLRVLRHFVAFGRGSHHPAGPGRRLQRGCQRRLCFTHTGARSFCPHCSPVPYPLTLTPHQTGAQAFRRHSRAAIALVNQPLIAGHRPGPAASQRSTNVNGPNNHNTSLPGQHLHLNIVE